MDRDPLDHVINNQPITFRYRSNYIAVEDYQHELLAMTKARAKQLVWYLTVFKEPTRTAKVILDWSSSDSLRSSHLIESQSVTIGYNDFYLVIKDFQGELIKIAKARVGQFAKYLEIFADHFTPRERLVLEFPDQ
jgi:hypothetical protein